MSVKDVTLDTRKQTVTEAVVLVEGIEGKGKGHHLYMDNYYSSLSLYIELKRKGIGACGTVRKGMPKKWKGNGKDSVKGRMKKGDVETTILNSNKVTALLWKDKRVVSMLSIIHGVDMTSRDADGGHEEIQKPVMVEKCNMYMGGVDKSDQFLSSTTRL